MLSVFIGDEEGEGSGNELKNGGLLMIGYHFEDRLLKIVDFDFVFLGFGGFPLAFFRCRTLVKYV